MSQISPIASSFPFFYLAYMYPFFQWPKLLNLASLFLSFLEIRSLSPGIFPRHCWKDLHCSCSSLCATSCAPTTEILVALTGLRKLRHILLSHPKSEGSQKKSPVKNSSYTFFKGSTEWSQAWASWFHHRFLIERLSSDFQTRSPRWACQY